MLRLFHRSALICVPHFAICSIEGSQVSAVLIQLQLVVTLIHIQNTEDRGAFELKRFVFHS